MNLKKIIFLISYCSCIYVFAQEDPVITKSENTFVNKLSENQPRPKFFELKYAFVRDVSISSKSDIFGRDENEIEFNPRITLKLRAPISLKPKFNLIGAFKMRQEFFDFENSENENNKYFENLDRRRLQSYGLSLFMKKDLSEKKFLYAYWNGNLNSDNVSFGNFIDQFRTNISVIFVKNLNELTQIGYGGAFGYVFGGATIFPVFVYNQTFSDKWSFEAMLPKSIKLRYSNSPGMHSYLLAKINGASYFLKEPTVEGFDKVTFQRSAVNVSLKLEKEIYDWLWFSVDAGYNFPINLFISEPRKKRKDAIITLSAASAPIFGFSIFAVVPKKMLYKKAKKG